MTEKCPTCGAAVRVESSGVTHYMVPVADERVRELESAMRAALSRSPLVMADAMKFREVLGDE